MRAHGIVLAVFLVILVGVTAGLGSLSARADKLPIRTVKVTIAKTQREDFINEIKTFADSYGLAFRVAQISPNPEHIHVQMWREDVSIDALNNSDTGAPDLTYAIFFYTNGDHPITIRETDQL